MLLAALLVARALLVALAGTVATPAGTLAALPRGEPVEPGALRARVP